MRRIPQIVLIATLIPLCWLGMMAVHELGHVVGARLTGATVTKVVLHPLKFSRTGLTHNPHPLAVAWSGPVVGCLLPLAAWGVAWVVRFPGAYLLRFFAGFCLIANGAYLAEGAVFYPAGDARELLDRGSPLWQLVLFGLAAIPLGLFLWRRLGPKFGLGLEADGQVGLIAAAASPLLLAATAAAMLILF